VAGEDISHRIALLVWIERDRDGHIEGIVERLRTHEKARFRGVRELGALIERLAGASSDGDSQIS
jgi:hypothetical protein